MNSNPFSPPQSVVADAALPLLAASKPVSVWVTQIGGMLLACAAGVGLYRGVMALLPGSGMSWQRAAGMIAIQFAATALLLVVAFESQRRTRAGRWLGLLLVGVLLLYIAVRLARASGLIGGTLPESPGSLIAHVTMFLLAGWWFSAFGFSARSRAWFGIVRGGDAARGSDRWRP